MHLWSKPSENKELLELLNLSGWNYGVACFFLISCFFHITTSYSVLGSLPKTGHGVLNKGVNEVQ